MNEPEDIRKGLPSASALEIVVQCPGQPQLKRTIPKEAVDTSDEWAERGTRIHKAFETGSIQGLEDEEEIETFETGRKYRDLLVNEWRIARGMLEGDVKDGTPESRFWLHHPQTLRPLASGQLDKFYTGIGQGGEHALILDLKSGWNPNLAPVERSWQLRLQALLLWKERPEIQTIRVAFVKPKGRLYPGDSVDYLPADLEESERMVFHHLWLAEQPGAPRRAGRHCNYCPCKAYCPDAASYALLPSVLAAKVAPEMDFEGIVETLRVEDLALIFERSNIVTKILDAVKARLKTLPVAELDRLGLEFGKPRNLDPIVKTKEAFDVIKKEIKDESKIWECLSFSKGELQKTLQRELGWAADPAKGWINGRLEPFIEKKQSAAPLKQK